MNAVAVLVLTEETALMESTSTRVIAYKVIMG